ncbi:serine hydrolase domain-containing protein [Microbulbifer sp. SSSA007]|uniref:serine hydrolase domain-containing protein n=1 Tax=Microbulbifer sp. SSSA007 TaxID=3243379 RepID=UPI00403A2A84
MALRFLTIIIMSLMIGSNCYAIANNTEKEIKSALAEMSSSNRLIGSHFVAVVDKNGLDFFYAYSKDGPKVTESTPILIASHTKSFTSTLMAILHSSGKLDLDKPISSYKLQLGLEGKVDTNKISIRDLLTHTAGFTSVQHTFKSAFLGHSGREELIDSLSENLLVAPDYNFRYSNTGPIVASMIAENITGITWGELIEEYIADPLDMNATTSNVSKVRTILPSIITSSDSNIFNSGHFKSDLTMHPSGGLVSTVNDLAIWLQANINKDRSNLSKIDIFDELHEKQVDQSKTYFTYERSGYTLGWDLAEYNQETLLTRFGNYGGYSIHVSFMPEREVGVIAFTNQDAAYILPHVIANYAYNSILNKKNRDILFEQEMNRLKKSVLVELSEAPDSALIVSSDDFPDNLLGTFINSSGWPKQKFYIDNGKVMVDWGVLNGPLLKDGKKYMAHFGVFQREIAFLTLEGGDIKCRNGS